MSARDPHPKDGRSAPEGKAQEVQRLAAANKAAIARNLARLYGEVLDAPLPDDLAELIQRLEAQETNRH